MGRYPNIITGVQIAIDQGEGRFGLYRDIVPGRQIAIGQSERPGVALLGFEKDVIPGIKHRLIDDHGGVGRYPNIITGVQIGARESDQAIRVPGFELQIVGRVNNALKMNTPIGFQNGVTAAGNPPLFSVIQAIDQPDIAFGVEVNLAVVRAGLNGADVDISPIGRLLDGPQNDILVVRFRDHHHDVMRPFDLDINLVCSLKEDFHISFDVGD